MPFFASGEPDLFNQSAHVPHSEREGFLDDNGEDVSLMARFSAVWHSCVARLTRLFEHKEKEALLQNDDSVQQKRSARGQAFSAGVKRWGMGNGFSIQNFIPKKQTAWLFGAGAAILISCITIGVVMVFRMATSVQTPGEGAGRPSLKIDRVCPIPDMYVD